MCIQSALRRASAVDFTTLGLKCHILHIFNVSSGRRGFSKGREHNTLLPSGAVRNSIGGQCIIELTHTWENNSTNVTGWTWTAYMEEFLSMI